MKHPFSRILSLAITLLAAGVAYAASPLPAPSGPYAVGRTEFYWVDPSRPDAQNPGRHRELAVWVWYPAAPQAGAATAQWMPGKWGQLYSSEMAARSPLLAGGGDIVSGVHTHAYEDAPLASARKRYPVLMFEPGLGVAPLVYATLLEDAASHGYIVVGVTPTYYTRYSVLSGGRVAVPHVENPGRLPRLSRKRTAEFDHPIRVEGQIAYTNMDARKARAMIDQYQSHMHSLLRAAFPDWVRDMVFSLDQVAKLNSQKGGRFAGRIDLAHVGAFGHSFGGAAALQAAKEDPRITAAITLDGTPIGSVMTAGLPKPLLNFRHHNSREPAMSASETGQWASLMRSARPGYWITLDGTGHPSFSDEMTVMTSIGAGPPGPPPGRLLPPAQALRIISTYVDAFFDEYLKGEKSTLLSGPSPKYPGISFVTDPR